MNLTHFILAKIGSDAARVWNKQSIDGIMTEEYRRHVNVVTEMISFINIRLPQLFINDNKQENYPGESNKERFRVQEHVKQPYIVLSHRKRLDDLDQDPYKLTLSPKPFLDDAGYFFGVGSMDNGHWKLRYSLFETNDAIHAMIELAGITKNNIDAKIFEEVIIIKGRRADLKELLTSPLIRHVQIPIGEFKLEISLKCKGDPNKAELELHEGLYKITCPKKKATAERLERRYDVCSANGQKLQ